MAGPLAWLGSLPFLGSLPQLGQATVAVLGRVGAASLVVSGAVAVGNVKATTPTTVAPPPVQLALPSTQAPAGAVGVGPDSARSEVAPVVPRGSSTTLGVPAGSVTTVSKPDPGTTTTQVGSAATVPLPVTGVTASAANGQASVSWSAPNDSGSPITSYTVTRYVGGVAQVQDTVPASVTTEVETGLADGTTYTFTVTATNAVGSSPPSAPSLGVTPIAPSLSIVNGATLAGRPQKGDQIIVTFSPAPSLGALCAGWSSTSYPDLDDSNVVVSGTQAASGDDTISVTDATDCNGGFHFGSIDLGQGGYFTGDVTFGGNVSGCRNAKTTGCSSIHWDGQDTLTITLGAVSSTQSTQTAPSVAVYTPSPALDIPGTITSASEENF